MLQYKLSSLQYDNQPGGYLGSDATRNGPPSQMFGSYQFIRKPNVWKPSADQLIGHLGFDDDDRDDEPGHCWKNAATRANLAQSCSSLLM
jgi:hypothetical protein